jgi:proteasome lid subunit RPN8/RPN11
LIMNSESLQLQIISNTLDGIKSAVENNVEECCGFLFGTDDVKCRRITDFITVENAAPYDKERTYQISAKDYIQAENFAEQNSLQLVGVYHSHPNCAPIPSEYDRRAAQPFFSYLILSVTDGTVDAVRSWRLNNDDELEEEFFSTENINYPVHGYRNYSNTTA